jgi:hypothetical protein
MSIHSLPERANEDLPTEDLLSPVTMHRMADQLDVAGETMRSLCCRSRPSTSTAFAMRAARCFAAAQLLRRIAE